MSDQPVAFDCPSCGGPLDAQTANNNLIQCPYCAKSVIVPESLREKDKQRGFSTVIQVGSGGAMRINMGDEDDPAVDVQTFVIPQVAAAQTSVTGQRKANTAWISWLFFIISLVILLSVIASVVAPILFTGMVWNEVKQVIPGLGDTKPQQVPDVSSTIETVLTQVVGPVTYLTPEPTFYTADLVFGEKGIGPGMFDDTRWVTVDAEGNLYTAEYQDGRVQKFNPDGSFGLLWNVKDRVALMDIAINRAGIVYLTIQGEILKFDAETGKALGSVTYPGDYYFSALAPTADGGLVAITDGETVVRFDAAEQVTLTIPNAVSSITEDNESSARPAVDGRGNIYVLATIHEGILVYSPEGKYLNRIGSGGNEPEQLRAVNDIVVDGKGRIFVSDIKGVMVFNTDGRYEGIIDVEGAPFGLALDDQNRLIVMTNKPKLYKMSVGEVTK